MHRLHAVIKLDTPIAQKMAYTVFKEAQSLHIVAVHPFIRSMTVTVRRLPPSQPNGHQRPTHPSLTAAETHRPNSNSVDDPSGAPHSTP